MRKILLDTNAYSAYRRGDPDVLETLADADRVYLSSIVLGELYFGFKQGAKESKNRKELKSFVAKSTVRLLHVTEETAEVFADVKTSLTKKGTPIPLNDVWISAHCLETGSVLVTYDAHFTTVDGLRIWR
jgi:tRNA(fMet)-specific endonuclease VapC